MGGDGCWAVGGGGNGNGRAHSCAPLRMGTAGEAADERGWRRTGGGFAAYAGYKPALPIRAGGRLRQQATEVTNAVGGGWRRPGDGVARGDQGSHRGGVGCAAYRG